MQCDRAVRMLHAGEASQELDVHLSACDACRAVADDLAQLASAFARARADWKPSPFFHVRLPMAPWRRLAIAASLLVVPLAAWAAASVASGRPAERDLGLIVEPMPAPSPSDREVLGMIFLQETRP